MTLIFHSFREIGWGACSDVYIWIKFKGENQTREIFQLFVILNLLFLFFPRSVSLWWSYYLLVVNLLWPKGSIGQMSFMLGNLMIWVSVTCIPRKLLSQSNQDCWSQSLMSQLHDVISSWIMRLCRLGLILPFSNKFRICVTI